MTTGAIIGPLLKPSSISKGKLKAGCLKLIRQLIEYDVPTPWKKHCPSPLLIAVIDLEHDEEPHIIFETLNARGEALTQSDLVKNTVMYQAGVVDEADAARRLWGMFDSDEWWRKATGESRLGRIQLDRLLNHWM